MIQRLLTELRVVDGKAGGNPSDQESDDDDRKKYHHASGAAGCFGHGARPVASRRHFRCMVGAWKGSPGSPSRKPQAHAGPPVRQTRRILSYQKTESCWSAVRSSGGRKREGRLQRPSRSRSAPSPQGLVGAPPRSPRPGTEDAVGAAGLIKRPLKASVDQLPKGSQDHPRKTRGPFQIRPLKLVPGTPITCRRPVLLSSKVAAFPVRAHQVVVV